MDLKVFTIDQISQQSQIARDTAQKIISRSLKQDPLLFSKETVRSGIKGRQCFQYIVNETPLKHLLDEAAAAFQLPSPGDVGFESDFGLRLIQGTLTETFPRAGLSARSNVLQAALHQFKIADANIDVNRYYALFALREKLAIIVEAHRVMSELPLDDDTILVANYAFEALLSSSSRTERELDAAVHSATVQSISALFSLGGALLAPGTRWENSASTVSWDDLISATWEVLTNPFWAAVAGDLADVRLAGPDAQKRSTVAYGFAFVKDDGKSGPRSAKRTNATEHMAILAQILQRKTRVGFGRNAKRASPRQHEILRLEFLEMEFVGLGPHNFIAPHGPMIDKSALVGVDIDLPSGTIKNGYSFYGKGLKLVRTFPFNEVVWREGRFRGPDKLSKDIPSDATQRPVQNRRATYSQIDSSEELYRFALIPNQGVPVYEDADFDRLTENRHGELLGELYWLDAAKSGKILYAYVFNSKTSVVETMLFTDLRYEEKVAGFVLSRGKSPFAQALGNVVATRDKLQHQSRKH